MIEKAIRDKARMTDEALLTNFTALTLDTNDSLDQPCHKTQHRTTQCTRNDCPTKNNQTLRQAQTIMVQQIHQRPTEKQ